MYLPLYYVGVFQVVMAGATVLANILCGWTIKIFGAPRAAAVSAALIALGLLGFCVVMEADGVYSRSSAGDDSICW
jgi:hypothetical protein